MHNKDWHFIGEEEAREELEQMHNKPFSDEELESRQGFLVSEAARTPLEHAGTVNPVNTLVRELIELRDETKALVMEMGTAEDFPDVFKRSFEIRMREGEILEELRQLVG